MISPHISRERALEAEKPPLIISRKGMSSMREGRASFK